MRIVQAARIKARMTEELGPPVDIHGDADRAFPAPARLRGLEHFPGLSARKVGNLRALAEGADEDDGLDADRLRSVPVADALASLRELPGIGPFSAELILLRGAGAPDVLASAEPRLRRAVALAYGMGHEPTSPEVEALAEGWRPYRTWASFLLRVNLEEETSEIASGGRPS